MTALAAKFFPKASFNSVADFQAIAAIAMFSGIGLLVSVTTIVLDKYLPGEWF